MKKYLSAIIILILLLSFSYSSFASEIQSKTTTSDQTQLTLKNFKQNLNRIYQENYNLFWDTYYYYMNEAETCQDLNKTAEFLEISYFIGGNAEIQEGFHEFLEKMILVKTECFLNAALMLHDKSLEKLINSYVSKPIFTQYDQINKAINKYSDKKEYKHFFDMYK